MPSPSSGDYFFGKFKIVTPTKKVLETNDVTNSQIEDLSIKANFLIRSNCSILACDFYKKICKFHILGATVDWECLYTGKSHNKVSLPLYPFEKKRNWVEVPWKWNGRQRFYTNLWNEIEIGEKNREDYNPENIVVLKSNSKLCLDTVKKLEETGHKVIQIDFDNKFLGMLDGRFIISHKYDDYFKLFNALKSYSITKIIIFPFDLFQSPDDEIEELFECNKKDILRLFFIAKSIIHSKWSEKCEITVITETAFFVTNTEKKLNARFRGLIGLAKTISLECPEIDVRSIDVDTDTSAESVISSTLGGSQEIIAYRSNKKYEVKFQEMEETQIEFVECSIKENGTYIITGGTGGIGLETARFLSEKNKVNLVLINRGSFPKREDWEMVLDDNTAKKVKNQISKILEMEKNGSNVLIIQGDVSSKTEMERVFDTVRKRFHRVNGIIHSAGIAGGGFIYNKEISDFEQLLSAKIKGSIILDELTQKEELDFFVLYSSISSHAGIEGQSDYVAANAFLHGFAEERSRLGKKTLCISWPAWKETGMALNYSIDLEQSLFKALTNAEGTSCLYYLMNTKLANIAVGEINNEETNGGDFFTNKISQQRKNPNTYINTSRTNSVLVVLTGRESKVYSSTEILVAKLWGEIFKLSEVDVYTNFYEIGGDSIYGMKLISSISNAIGRNLSILDLLSHLTISELAKFIDDEMPYEMVEPDIESVGKREYYPTTPLQKQLFASNQLFPDNLAYNITKALRIRGVLDTNLLSNAIKRIIERHEALRTRIYVKDGEIVQSVISNVGFFLEEITKLKNTMEETIQNWLRPYDLGESPLFRVGLIKKAHDDYIMVIDFHHIISDDQSMQLFISELVHFYSNSFNSLPDIKLQYKEYAVWQEKINVQSIYDEKECYWYKKLKQPPTKVKIPQDFSSNDIVEFEGKRIQFVLKSSLTLRIKWLSTELKTTAFVLLSTALFIVLNKYTDSHDIIIGVPVSGRKQMELNETIGLFVKTLPIRCSISSQSTISKLIDTCRVDIMSSFSNQDIPYQHIARKVMQVSNNMEDPLFDVIIVQHQLNKEKVNIGDMQFEAVDIGNKTSKYYQSLEFLVEESQISCVLEYRAKLYEEETMQDFISNFITVLEIMIEDPNIHINDISLKSALDNHLIEDEFRFDFE